MFTLVLFVCYLDGGCEDIVVDVYKTEQKCLKSLYSWAGCQKLSM